ncbi:MAG: hypothetical protein UV94_C0009G0006 [Parcubacteria group bacterium GW2011_GWC1_43_30]|nr:MAG: hypothetical protein UV94_C0009G0006 [Parcubacteria group bacterium GW2011_GWC1_43_30]
MTRRILCSVVILASILFLPYWIYIPVLFVGTILFPFFWEGIFLAFLIDAIHGSGMGVFPSLISPLTLSVLIVLVALLYIRERLRSYV